MNRPLWTLYNDNVENVDSIHMAFLNNSSYYDKYARRNCLLENEKAAI